MKGQCREAKSQKRSVQVEERRVSGLKKWGIFFISKKDHGTVESLLRARERRKTTQGGGGGKGYIADETHR